MKISLVEKPNFLMFKIKKISRKFLTGSLLGAKFIFCATFFCEIKKSQTITHL